MTQITETYKDGQTKSITGTGVVAQYFDYGAPADFTRFTTVRVKDNNETRYTKTTIDGLGREVSVVTPKYDVGTREEARSYNGLGQLVTETREGLGDVSYTYSDPFTTTSVLDAEPDADQVTTTSISYGAVSSHPYAADGWYRVTTSTIGAGGDQETAVRMEQISGLGMDSIVVDGQSNETVTHTVINRGTKTVTTTVHAPAVSQPSTNISVNRLVASTQASDQSDDTTYAYDDLRRLVTVVSPETGTSTYSYEDTPVSGYPKGVLEAITTRGQTTTYSYYPLSSANAGKLEMEVNPGGKSKVFAYNSRGQLTSITGSATYRIGYSYNDYGEKTELKTFRDATGSPDVTTWIYEPETGLLTSRMDAAGKIVGYTYTDAHLVDERTWARPGTIVTDYGYNGAGQLNSIVYSGDSDVTPDVSYTYNTAGRRKTASSSAMGTVTYTYDDNGMPLAEDYEGGPLDELLLTRTYSNAKRATLSAALDGSSIFQTQGYFYNGSTGRWDYITQGNARADYDYVSGRNLVAHVTHKWSSNPVVTRSLGYDSYGRMNSVENVVDSFPVNSHGTPVDPIDYDNRGRRTSIKREDGSTWTYGYNDRNEVTSGAKRFSDGTTYVPGHQFTYNYDDIGNRKPTGTAKGGGPDGAGLDSMTYTANNLNQYSALTSPGHIWITGEADESSQAFVNGVWAWRKGKFLAKGVTVSNSSGSVNQPITVESKLLGAGASGAMLVQEYTGHVLVSQASAARTYDEDGNLKNDGVLTYSWDAENRLIQIESASGVPASAKKKLTFHYDCMGRRIAKDVYTWNAGLNSYLGSPSESSLFVYDGWNLIAELDALDENSLRRSYTWGPDLSNTIWGAGGAGGLLKIFLPLEVGSPTVYPCYDANGNVTAFVNSSDSSVVAQYEYGPFGEMLRSMGPLSGALPIRFSSKYFDKETELLYYGFRYYSAHIGRWLSRDPIQEKGGNNLYSFVRNRSINSVDLLGLTDRSSIRARVNPLRYSCNCGWIDWGHAMPDAAERLLKTLENPKLKSHHDPDYYMVEFWLSQKVKKWGIKIVESGVRSTYGVRYDQSSDVFQISGDANGIGLGIYKEVSEAFEEHQGDFGQDSAFSEEDLISNLIGFYRAAKGYSKEEISKWCMELDADASEKVWDTVYGKDGTLGKNRKWTPVDHNASCTECKGVKMTFPTQFNSITVPPKGVDWRDSRPEDFPGL